MTERDLAVALGYMPGEDTAPRVLAAGIGETARRILAIARKEGLHIHRDDTLAKLLARVPVGQEIPETAYQLVADLLAFLAAVDRRAVEKVSTSERKNFPGAG